MRLRSGRSRVLFKKVSPGKEKTSVKKVLPRKPQARANPSIKDRLGGTVDIIVGDGADGSLDKFTIHENLICSRSAVIKAAVEIKSNEQGETREVSLPDVNPNIFAILVHWIYRNTLDYDTTVDISTHMRTIIDIYILALKLEIVTLQNIAIRDLHALIVDYVTVPGPKDINHIYRSTVATPYCAIRRLVVDSWSVGVASEGLSWDYDGKVCKEFFFDLAKRQTARLNHHVETGLQLLLPRKNIYIEAEEQINCALCIETLGSPGEEIVICRATCGTRLHRACMDKCAESMNGMALTCPLCRSLWEDD